MTVLLRRSDQVPADGWQHWAAVAATQTPAYDRRLPDLGYLLESCYDAIAPELLALGHQLSQRADAVFAHTPACAGNISDLGVILAWDRLITEWTGNSECLLLICDDPWLFRHWQDRPGVSAGTPPPLFPRRLKMLCRGWAARLLTSLRMAKAAFSLRSQRRMLRQGSPAIVVYGHPRSTPQGDDAYFGPLLKHHQDLTRLLHVDCPPARARTLQGDGRTLSLHAIGSVWSALALWTYCWRPRSSDWLVRRAAAHEASTGTPAMIAWQIHCQGRWLTQQKPAVVAWPWENHSWEREFVRQARQSKVRTVGYQHATTGRREWNYSPISNPDGPASLPDRILTVGMADRDRLAALGCPPDRLSIAGALRYAHDRDPEYDPAAPVLLALPFDAVIAAEMVEAARPLAAAGRRILVKDHPMSPFSFVPSAGLERTELPFSQLERLSAVIYCITTLGLEAVLAGLPTLRFVPSSRPVVDIMPDGFTVASATFSSLSETLERLQAPIALRRDHIFAVPDMDSWCRELAQ